MPLMIFGDRHLVSVLVSTPGLSSHQEQSHARQLACPSAATYNLPQHPMSGYQLRQRKMSMCASTTVKEGGAPRRRAALKILANNQWLGATLSQFDTTPERWRSVMRPSRRWEKDSSQPRWSSEEHQHDVRFKTCDHSVNTAT